MKLKLITTIVLTALLTACYNSNDAYRALHAQGFTEVHITGWSPLSCGEDDTFSTGFTAKNPQGQDVSGVVCSGLIFKNATVRF